MTRSETDADAPTPSPERLAELVTSLASVMRQSEMTELDLDVGAFSLRLRRPPRHVDCDPTPLPDVSGSADDQSRADHHIITAPMIGTYYASPTPGAQPFVATGDEVFMGQTIGIIEAMKIMNEIVADRAGTVEEIMVGNGQPVEYGSPLLQLSLNRSGRP